MRNPFQEIFFFFGAEEGPEGFEGVMDWKILIMVRDHGRDEQCLGVKEILSFSRLRCSGDGGCLRGHDVKARIWGCFDDERLQCSGRSELRLSGMDLDTNAVINTATAFLFLKSILSVLLSDFKAMILFPCCI